MAQKYHLSDDGQPRPCDAQKKCPKGGDVPHFEGDLKDARVWAEDRNSQEAGGNFSSPKKDPRETLQGDLDTAEKDLERAKELMMNARDTGNEKHSEDAEALLDSSMNRVLELRSEVQKRRG